MATTALPFTAAVPASEPADARREHQLYTSSLTREHGFEPLRVEGKIPEALRGTLYRNGPGQWDLFGQRYGHSFEGDGALCAVRLQSGQAQGAHRVIAGRGLQAERTAGKPLYGTGVGWPRRLWNGLRGDLKNAANTSVLHWQDNLLALFEAGRPTAIDPDTLETIGESDLGLGKELRVFSAHPHAVASRRSTYGFGVRVGAKNGIDLFELPAVGAARRLGQVSLPRAVMLHDAAVTERHFVFFVCPVEIVIWRALLGVGDFRSLWRYRPEHGTEVIVVPIDRPSEVVRFSVDAFFTWHIANAFERGSEIVVDLVRYPDFASMDQLGQTGMPIEPGTPTRMVIDPGSRKIASQDALCDRRGEFPCVDPRLAGAPHRAIWMTRDASPRASLLRVDPETGRTSTFELAPGERPSELLYVPHDKAPEGEGWALAMVFDPRSQASHLAIFDAARLEAGPIAKAHFDHHVPMSFHGTFVGR